MATLDDYSKRAYFGTVPASSPYVTTTTQRLPDWQRTYYESRILDTIRTKSILVPFTNVVEDFEARRTGTITYSEIYDLEPNWNSITESDVWFKGGSLDSRTVSLNLAMYHNIIKYSGYMPLTMYLNNGDVDGLVKNKIGIDVSNTMDILARNAFLGHPNPIYAGAATSRITLSATDLFDPDYAEEVRVMLEEDDIPGIMMTDDSAPTILCITTPRVIKDIRTAAGSDWLEVQEYEQTGRKFTGEVGMWAGVRFIKTNRLKLTNMGAVQKQTTLASATNPGQGAAATVDSVYTPGQTDSTRTVTLSDSGTFAVGDVVTFHSATASGFGGAGSPPPETDGEIEVRRVVSASGTTISLDKPLLKDHSASDYVTSGYNVHASIFMGGPSIVWGIAERPNIYIPPVIDDAMLIQRIGWRAYCKFQLFRPEYYKLVLSSGSDNT